MSINSLSNAAAARRSDMVPLERVPRGLSEIAIAAYTPAAATAPGAASSPSPASIDTMLHILFGYIPTEILTLYVAVLAAIDKPSAVTPAEWLAFWGFLVGTPIVVWLVYGAKIKAANKPLPLAPKAWPMWEMLAATVAFFAWAFALPNNPFSAFPWYSAGLSGVVVLITSTALALLAPFFQHPLGT